MHNVKLIRRRFPHHQRAILGGLLLLSGSALALGLGLMLLN